MKTLRTKSVSEIKSVSCILCGKTSIDHEINCTAASIFRWNRHQYVVKKLIQNIDNEKRPRIVLQSEHNLYEDGVRPDIELIFVGQIIPMYIDVCYA